MGSSGDEFADKACIEYRPLTSGGEGTVADLLRRAYAQLRELDQSLFKAWSLDWDEYDAEIHRNPETVGKCGWLQAVDGELCGMVSWDPRKHPEAQIGHNCIVPEYRQRGLGKAQLQRSVERLRTQGFTRLFVETNDHWLFVPARRMYEACGFQYVETREGHVFPFVVYEKLMGP